MVTEFRLKSHDKVFVLPRGKVVLGRDSSCDLVVEDDLVSRRHARLTVDEDFVLLSDLGSSNGSQVNGQTARGEVRLKPGDRVRFAFTEFELLAIPHTAEPHPTVQLAYCSACGSIMSLGMQFCVQCGRRVNPDTRCRACSNCHGRVAPNDQFCPSCGEQQFESPTPV